MLILVLTCHSLEWFNPYLSYVGFLCSPSIHCVCELSWLGSLTLPFKQLSPHWLPLAKRRFEKLVGGASVLTAHV